MALWILKEYIESEFKDFLENPIKVGDRIFYSTTGKYAESRLCEITRFTEKSIFGKILKSNRNENIGDEIIIKNDFVKVLFS